MSRLRFALSLALLLVPLHALADEEAVVEEADDSDTAIPDQSVGASVGMAGGGRTTAGGFRVEGHYLYQLSDQDWFDGTAGFTFGAGGAACFRDRMDDVICDHAFADGRGVEITAAVRRYFTAQGKFTPFARAGAGVGITRYGDDDLTGLVIPLHLGGGVRASLTPQVAIVVGGELVVGIGRFGRNVGTEPQLGLAVTAGAELRLP